MWWKVENEWDLIIVMAIAFVVYPAAPSFFPNKKLSKPNDTPAKWKERFKSVNLLTTYYNRYKNDLFVENEIITLVLYYTASGAWIKL